MLVAAVAVFVFTLLETRLPRFAGSSSLVGNVFFFLWLNFNIVLLVLLGFLIARHFVKLVVEKRQRILGSHLRARLVSAFLGVTFFPTVILFLVALGFMTNSIEKWFTAQVEHSLRGSLDIAEAYYDQLADTTLGQARYLAGRLGERGPRSREAKALVGAKTREYRLAQVTLLDAGGEILARASGPLAPSVPVNRELVARALRGEAGTSAEKLGGRHLVRAAVPVTGDGEVAAVLELVQVVPTDIARQSEAIARSFGEYRELKIMKRPIKNNYAVALVLIALLVMFCAVWMGFYVARGISGPLQRLAEGTRAVARGNLEYRIEGEGDDEIGTVVTSFNRMTGELRRTRAALVEGRRSMEIILANMTAGVVSLDRQGWVTTINPAARRLLETGVGEGRSADEMFAAPEFAPVRGLIGALREGHEELSETQVELTREGRVLTVVVVGAVLRDGAGASRGAVLFFEDVTHILRVQRMEAWREVARRIAHEIKNPLTPIQLSTERLRKRFAHRVGGEAAVFEECTRTIIQQVQELKRMVNEFALFARLPAAEHRRHDLNSVIDEALVLFREGHPRIQFLFEPGGVLPPVEMDVDGVRRALMNILDNAVAACAVNGNGRGRIVVRTEYDRELDVARLEVADNGCGISPEVKGRIFEPYFSTKAEGTGLGLAIVSTVVADHRGYIRVCENQPRGSRFVIELPVRRVVHDEARGSLARG